MPVIATRISAELHEAFLAQCGKRDLKPSDFIRKLIEGVTERMIDKPVEDENLGYHGTKARDRAAASVRGFAATDGTPLVKMASRLKTK